MRVGIDLDGVCYGFVESLRHHLITNKGYDPKRCEKYVRWEFYLDWGMTLEEFLAECHDGVNQGVIFNHGEAYPGVREALQRMKDGGHTLHVITDRSFGLPGASEAHTARWVARELPKVDSITFSADKTIGRVDLMIDDKLSNYDALDAVGCDVYLLNRPWNYDKGDSRRRVDTIGEFADRVREYDLVPV